MVMHSCWGPAGMRGAKKEEEDLILSRTALQTLGRQVPEAPREPPVFLLHPTPPPGLKIKPTSSSGRKAPFRKLPAVIYNLQGKNYL